ncbi:MAG TPA: SRPBCC family protein [Actinomycetota bacterium]|jgi:uncharacterized protein YndB with AHSA1/START domain|nr:SRPBCC family protein [Actinomycetota bacterium]
MSDNVAVHPTALVVHKEITVDVPVERAFEVFAAVDAWWIREHHNGPGELEEVVVEPREGGRCYNREVGGNEVEWGKVLAWEPPTRLVLGWQLNAQWTYEPDFVTEVEVTFAPESEQSTRVVLEHRNLDRYGDAAQEIFESLDSDGGWGGSLASFANATRGGK